MRGGAVRRVCFQRLSPRMTGFPSLSLVLIVSLSTFRYFPSLTTYSKLTVSPLYTHFLVPSAKKTVALAPNRHVMDVQSRSVAPAARRARILVKECLVFLNRRVS